MTHTPTLRFSPHAYRPPHNACAYGCARIMQIVSTLDGASGVHLIPIKALGDAVAKSPAARTPVQGRPLGAACNHANLGHGHGGGGMANVCNN